MSSSSFYPIPRTLMGPGPSDLSPRVLLALSRPTVGHLDPLFSDMLEDLKRLLRQAFITRNELTFPLSAPGSAGMECCFANLVEPGDQVIVCRNGVFGERMRENVIRCGATPIMVDDDWGRAVDPNKVEDAFKQHGKVKLLAFVHAETSTGAQSDAAALAGLAGRYGALSLADTVTSLGGTPVKVDEWGLDAVYSGSQKCLSCVPGLSPLTFSECARATLQGRETPAHSWFMDLNLIMKYWGEGQRVYHHTAPVNSLYALHEALLSLEEEGLENAWARHFYHHRALLAGLEAMGLSLLVSEAERLPQLNAVRVPEGVDEARARRRLLEAYHLEIGAGLGPLAGKIWRIGLMGHACHQRNVLYCLNSLEAVLREQGFDPGHGAGVTAALEIYGN